MSLLRLVRQGLASRRRDRERGLYHYRLSERGQSRLAYLDERSGRPRGRNWSRERETSERNPKVRP